MPLKNPAKKQARDLRNRQRHAERVASGTCTRCGRLPPEPGLKVCGSCAGKRRAADKARRAEARQQGKSYGGRDPERCRRADRASDRRRRRARQVAGLCTSCGRRRPEENRFVCEPCREARRALDRRRYIDRNGGGERIDKTEWHRAVTFQNGLIDMLEKHAKKGRLVYIAGKLQTRKWRKDGEDSDRFSTEILLVPGGRVQFLDRPAGANGNGAAPADGETAAAGDAAPADGTIPF